MRLASASWRGRLIARSGIVIPVLFFIVFEKVRMDASDIYNFHIWWDVSKFERKDFDRTDERGTWG